MDDGWQVVRIGEGPRGTLVRFTRETRYGPHDIECQYADSYAKLFIEAFNAGACVPSSAVYQTVKIRSFVSGPGLGDAWDDSHWTPRISHETP